MKTRLIATAAVAALLAGLPAAADQLATQSLANQGKTQ